jgi:2-polyprenyl-3-methyl-5-hydroxy-6-metoxy-1,4-benzoquinol methylase
MRMVNPSAYTESYYLKDCSGYDEFKKSWGKKLEPRLARIVKGLPTLKKMRVLDLGCGRGELVFWSANLGAKEVVGIDYSKAAIKLANEAKKHYPKKIREKIKFEVNDVVDINIPDNRFDVILMTEVSEHLYPEQQDIVFDKIFNILSKDGTLLIHTAPSKWFNDYTYRLWCYPISTLIVKVNNLFTRHKYGNLQRPSEIRSDFHKAMHVNEPNYFALKELFTNTGFSGRIYSTNVTISKPQLSWKDRLYNLIVYLDPLSHYPPFNILFGNDFLAILHKRTR